MTMSLEKLAKAATDICVERGDFSLAYAGRSDWRIAADRLVSRPDTAEAVTRSIIRILNAWKIRTVIPVIQGGAAIAAQVAVCSYCQPQSPIQCYGLRGINQETEAPPPGPAAILEDVVTTGKSAIKTAKLAKARGAEVGLIIAVVKRLDHPADEAIGIPWQTLLTAHQTPDGAITLQPAPNVHRFITT